MNDQSEKDHLPIYGVGPFYGIGVILLTIVGIPLVTTRRQTKGK